MTIQTLATWLPQGSQLIFLAPFAVLLIVAIASKSFGAWLTSALLATAGAGLVLFPNYSSLILAIAAGLGSLVVVGAARSRNTLLLQVADLQEQVRMLSAEQGRRFLRDLNNDKQAAAASAAPAEVEAEAEVVYAEPPAPQPAVLPRALRGRPQPPRGDAGVDYAADLSQFMTAEMPPIPQSRQAPLPPPRPAPLSPSRPAAANWPQGAQAARTSPTPPAPQRPIAGPAVAHFDGAAMGRAGGSAPSMATGPAQPHSQNWTPARQPNRGAVAMIEDGELAVMEMEHEQPEQQWVEFATSLPSELIPAVEADAAPVSPAMPKPRTKRAPAKRRAKPAGDTMPTDGTPG